MKGARFNTETRFDKSFPNCCTSDGKINFTDNKRISKKFILESRIKLKHIYSRSRGRHNNCDTNDTILITKLPQTSASNYKRKLQFSFVISKRNEKCLCSRIMTSFVPSLELEGSDEIALQSIETYHSFLNTDEKNNGIQVSLDHGADWHALTFVIGYK